jgi:hypothetical protein
MIEPLEVDSTPADNYLEAISKLEHADNPVSAYLDWLLERNTSTPVTRYFGKKLGGWRLEAPNATDLIMAILVLEEAKVTVKIG